MRTGLMMENKIFGLLVILLLAPDALSKSKSRLAKLQVDALSKTRCDLTCIDVVKENRSECRAQCRAQEQKPGTCPGEDLPQWQAACVKTCDLDYQCDGTQRCCHHGCGSTCSEPTDLLTLPGLPALPIIEEVKEKRKSILIRWSDGVGDLARAVPGKILYLLEEQHHLGPKYEETRLGGWNLLLRTNKTRISLRNVLKPGRWYRFRVAAISSAGSRGFSSPSLPFYPRKGPRAPPPPKRLRVRPVRTENGTVTVRLEWKEPNSDLPVNRYKVYWSRRVRGVTGDLDSVLVNHLTVPRDKTYAEIKELKPNSMYFLQVQTISQFGTGKLRSDKAAVFYNTTSTPDIPPQSLKKHEKSKRVVKNLKLHKVIWQNGKLKARISWSPISSSEIRRYVVQWRTEKCENPQHENKVMSATTEQTSFEIYELDYDCTYKVNVNKSRKSVSPDSEILVAVPGCDYFQRRMNGTVFNCDL
ncbi:anosmin-1 [Leguminivora glycinivorella]|uniref:anosmin-1 n=1 Tax=Leguminivora glycinivorella TaxID=1035111 RepID=UPI00200FE64C|nr:anosmin-1 [Leguminivora glycinivorella]XP_048006972.1 anosmin-1 [Leguminivora glycinivorella]